jgi:hypothetical protein
MKSVFTSALIAGLLVLTQTAQAAVVREFKGDSPEAQELAEALSMADANYNCIDSRTPKTRKFSLSAFTGGGADDMGGAYLGSSDRSNVSIHDGSSPLIELVYNINATDNSERYSRAPQAQTLFYTNKELTSVTRILRRVYNFKHVNKGTLYKPNIVEESFLKYTVDCRLEK